jgi:hypothetical protein
MLQPNLFDGRNKFQQRGLEALQAGSCHSGYRSEALPFGVFRLFAALPSLSLGAVIAKSASKFFVLGAARRGLRRAQYDIHQRLRRHWVRYPPRHQSQLDRLRLHRSLSPLPNRGRSRLSASIGSRAPQMSWTCWRCRSKSVPDLFRS